MATHVGFLNIANNTVTDVVHCDYLLRANSYFQCSVPEVDRQSLYYAVATFVPKTSRASFIKITEKDYICIFCFDAVIV